MPSPRFPLLLAAVVVSVATSSRPIPYDEGVTARLILHNAGSEPLVVGLQEPAAPAVCSLLREFPELLGSITWIEPIPLELQPGENRSPAAAAALAECTVVRVTLPGEEPRILFGAEVDFPTRSFPFSYEELGQVAEAVLVLAPDSLQPFRPTSPGMVWNEPESLGECGPPPKGATLDWFTDFAGAASIEGIEVSSDGCWNLDLRDDHFDHHPLYVCTPDLPFEVGETVQLSSDAGALTLSLIDPVERRTLFLSRSADRLPYQLSFGPRDDASFMCVDTFDWGCTQVRADGAQVFRGGVPAGPLEPGEPSGIVLDDAIVEVWLFDSARTLSGSCGDRVEAAVVAWGK